MSVQQEIKRLTAPDIRARIIAEAEALERRTKPAGGRNGVLGYVGLAVLSFSKSMPDYGEI